MHFYPRSCGVYPLSDSAYKNTSIHDGLTWSEIIPKKKSLINKNGVQGDLVIAINETVDIRRRVQALAVVGMVL